MTTGVHGLAVLARLRMFVLPAALLLAVTLPHLDQGDFRGDTGWYSALGLQAWRTGSFWTLYADPGQPYFNKPPLVFWVHGLVLHVFGPSVVAARAPTVLAALGCVLLTVAITRELAGRRAAVFAGIALALSLEFFRRVREISLDMWQLLFMLAALWLCAVAARRGKPGLLAAAGVPIGLALLCKPLNALLVIPIVGVWLAWTGRVRMLPWLGGTLLGALAVAAPWHLSMWRLHGSEFLGQYFGAEILDRAAGRLGADHNVNPPWFYVHRLATLYWPWLLLAGAALVRWARGRGLPGMDLAPKLALVWTVAWLAALTVYSDRRDRYGQPLYPGLAMLCGLWWATIPAHRPPSRWALRWLGPAVVACAAVFALLPVRIHAKRETHWPDLYQWLRSIERGGGRAEGRTPELWQGGFSAMHGARLYLEFGEWPLTTRDRRGAVIAEPPEGARLIYHRRDGLEPGANEAEVWRSGDGAIYVTRLGEGGWRPRGRDDPGG